MERKIGVIGYTTTSLKITEDLNHIDKEYRTFSEPKSGQEKRRERRKLKREK
jgi:hypothetical protein